MGSSKKSKETNEKNNKKCEFGILMNKETLKEIIGKEEQVTTRDASLVCANKDKNWHTSSFFGDSPEYCSYCGEKIEKIIYYY